MTLGEWGGRVYIENTHHQKANMIKVLKSELFTRNAAAIITEPFRKYNLIPSKNTKTFINDTWESAYYEFIIPKVATQEQKLSIKIVRNKEFDFIIYPYKYAKNNVYEDGEYICIDVAAILSQIKIVQEKSKKRSSNRNAYIFRNQMLKYALDEYLESIGIFAPSKIHERGVLYTNFYFDNPATQHKTYILIRTMPTNYEKEMELPIDQSIFRCFVNDWSVSPVVSKYPKSIKTFRCGLQKIESKLVEQLKIDTCRDTFSVLDLKDDELPFAW